MTHAHLLDRGKCGWLSPQLHTSNGFSCGMNEACFGGEGSGLRDSRLSSPTDMGGVIARTAFFIMALCTPESRRGSDFAHTGEWMLNSMSRSTTRQEGKIHGVCRASPKANAVLPSAAVCKSAASRT